MIAQQGRSWLPPALGAVALLLAAEKVRGLVVQPASMIQEFLFGLALEGTTAWIASILLMLLLTLISTASFRRRRDAVWASMGYCIYLAVSYWVWLRHYSVHSEQTKLISGAFFTGLMLALCRFLFDRRGQFDQ